MLLIQPAYEQCTTEILNQYGHIIVNSVSYDDCVRAYGPLFVEWYKNNYTAIQQNKQLHNTVAITLLPAIVTA